MNTSVYSEFSSIEDLLTLFNGFDNNIDTVPEDESLSYLDRGERLINTLRAKQARKAELFVTDEFLDIIDQTKYSLLSGERKKFDYVIKRVKDRILSPIVRAYAPPALNPDGPGITPSDASAFINIMKKFPMFSVKKCVAQDTTLIIACRALTYERLSKVKEVYELHCRFDKSDYYFGVPFPEDARPTPGRNLVTYYKTAFRDNKYAACDFAASFCSLYFYIELKRLYSEAIEKIRKDEDREFETSPLCCFIKQELEALKEQHSKYGFFYVRKAIAELPYVKAFLSCNCPQVIEVDKETQIPAGIRPLERYNAFLLWLVYGSAEDMPIQLDFFSRTERRLGIAFGSDRVTYAVKVFDLLLDEYTEERRAHELRVRTATEHARSFEPLRGLSEKLQKDMEKSEFNNYFSYVEYDPDAIRDKNGEISFEVLDKNGKVISTETVISEFKAIAKIFGFKKQEGVSLRFRRLGNHRASGLWYPSLKCMCIDFRMPSSFIHEYGHLLDTQARSASRSDAFLPIKELYSGLLRKAANKDKDLGDRLKKGKYSLDYYLTATEVFARTFEMYMSRCCGISNVLINPSEAEGFAYPRDPSLEQKIRDYFDIFLSFDSLSLFRKLHPEADEGAEELIS